MVVGEGVGGSDGRQRKGAQREKRNHRWKGWVWRRKARKVRKERIYVVNQNNNKNSTSKTKTKA